MADLSNHSAEELAEFIAAVEQSIAMRLEIARRKAATMEGIEVEEFTDPRAVQLFAEQRIAEGYLNCAEAVANTYGKLRAMLDTPTEDTILEAD